MLRVPLAGTCSTSRSAATLARTARRAWHLLPCEHLNVALIGADIVADSCRGMERACSGPALLHLFFCIVTDDACFFCHSLGDMAVARPRAGPGLADMATCVYSCAHCWQVAWRCSLAGHLKFHHQAMDMINTQRKVTGGCVCLLVTVGPMSLSRAPAAARAHIWIMTCSSLTKSQMPLQQVKTKPEASRTFFSGKSWWLENHACIITVLSRTALIRQALCVLLNTQCRSLEPSTCSS